MKKYKTSKPGCGCNLIEEVEVDLRTEMTVWTDIGRVARISDSHGYFDTWEEAHKYLLDRATS